MTPPLVLELSVQRFAAVVLAVSVVAEPSLAQAQIIQLTGETYARVIRVGEAARKAHPSVTARAVKEFFRAFDLEFGPDVMRASIMHDEPSLLITLETPIVQLRAEVASALTDFTDLPRQTLRDETVVIIKVESRRADAPDVRSITLFRDDNVRPPFLWELLPREFTTSRGRKVTRLSGFASYFVSDFDPGPIVRIVCATDGTPIEWRMDRALPLK